MADFFNDSIKGLKEAIDSLAKYKQSLIDIVTIEKKQATAINPAKAKAEDVNKLDASTKKLIETEEKLIKVTKEEEKAAKQLNFLRSEQGKIAAENSVLLTKQRKQNKDHAKDVLGLSTQYQKLSAQLIKDRNAAKELGLQWGLTSKKFKNAQKDVLALDKKLKDVDKSVGQNFRSVGNYNGAIGKLTPLLGTFGSKLESIKGALTKAKEGFKGMSGAQKGAATSSKALRLAMLAIPIFAIIAAITGLIKVFAGTQRGMNALRKVTEPLKAIFTGLLGVIEDITFWLADKLGEAFDNPMQAIKDLGNAILENVINRFKAFLVMGEAIGLLLSGEFSAAAKKGTDAMIQLNTGITDATDKIIEATEKSLAFIDTMVEIGNVIAQLKEDLEIKERDLIIPLAKARLEFEKYKQISRDALKTDEERVQALRDAEKEQHKINKGEADLLDMKIKILALEQSTTKTPIADQIILLNLQKEKLKSEEKATRKINELIALKTAMLLRINNQEIAADIAEAKRIQDLAELEAERRQANIDGVLEEWELKKKLAQDELDLIREVTEEEEIFDPSKDIAAEKKRLKEKALSEIQFAQDVTSELGEELEERNNKHQESLKDEEGDIKTAIQVQQGLAEKGLENTLAFENEQLAKNQLEQLEAEKKAAQLKEAIRLGELFLTLKEAEAKIQVQGSTGKALAGVAESKAITAGIKATVSAFEKGGLVEGDDQLIRINEKGQEFVIDADTTSALGLDKKGSNMGDFKGMMSMHEMNKSDRVVQDSDGNLKVIEAVQNLNNTLKNKPEHFIDLDKFGNIISEIKRGGVTNRVVRKTNSRL